ncbi:MULTISPECIES: hypothetical protein [Leptospira]|uniref:General secretion pathway protein GspM n=2 Tax=Leptospira vanthielii TaxID=293085 RepID=A0ABY2NPA8_9LEPT|nr:MULTISPECIES: hypothetical protein [Leptospira]EMY68750.1 hypothetical protein LEP1GSC199_1844 [Leptospira vanthielii serovar Holland str. Waz Holland = ATCC 700522]MBM9589402.1 hypothetical protein [Leptospira chreensis]TGM56718.1 hypothetical protein EHQ95_08720 [Leptospira vanthielii]
MFDRLNDRERVLVTGLISFVALLGIYTIITLFSDLRNSLTEEIFETRTQATELDRVIREYNYLRGLQSGGSEEDVSVMYSKLDQILVRYNLKDKVQTMKDTSNVIQKDYNKITIDVSFRSVLLQDIIKLVYDIEKNKQIQAKVDLLSFRKPFAEKEIYDVNLKVSSYSRLSKGK